MSENEIKNVVSQCIMSLSQHHADVQAGVITAAAVTANVLSSIFHMDGEESMERAKKMFDERLEDYLSQCFVQIQGLNN